MSDVFSRQAGGDRTKGVRRLLVGAALVVVLSITWHGLRPYLVRALARSSIGCPTRTNLVAAGVRDLYPQFPVAEAPHGPKVWSHRGPSHGLVTWQAEPEVEPLKPGDQPRIARYVLADEKLAYVGSVYSSYPPLLASPGDWDADGRVEITGSCVSALSALGSIGSLNAWVVRPGAMANEVGGIIVVDTQQWQKQSMHLWPYWRDENADGRAELAFVAWRIGALPGGRTGVLSQETVAVFEWSEPGGILRPRHIPDDGSFLVWTPEDGKPYEFSPDTVVDDVCRELLPIPDDFGQPSASQPASQPASEPSTRPTP
jgi:hypothetical protein